jgi:hypothetical protein
MSLKPCKECGKEISTKAEKCPHCGVKISNHGCLLAMIVVGFSIGLFNILNGSDASNKNASEPVDNRTSAIGACREFISQSLHNPSSAEYDVTSNAFAEQISPNVWKVQRKVRAENGFGALRLSDFECQVELVGNNWKANSVKQLN